MLIHLLPDSILDGATNMAADETMVHAAAAGVASLRFYGWTTATVSLGYFQPAAARLSDARLATLPWVRRPSGGATLVHHHELTYAIALPRDAAWHAEPWMPRMHRIIARTLADLGVPVETVSQHHVKHGDILCFQQHTPGDLRCGHGKVVGSAQRKYRLALMQHGSILLAQSEHAPRLPGIKELTGVELAASTVRDTLLQAFTDDTGWEASVCDWTEAERVEIRELAEAKYASATWNEKR